MHAPWFRATMLTLAASCVTISLAGCKRPVEQADQTLDAQLKVAQAQLAAGPKKIDAALASFQQAANVQGTSDAARAAAKLSLANVEQHIADRLILQSEQKQADVYQLATLLNQQTERIVAGGLLNAGYQALDPKAALDAIAKQSTGAQSGTGDDKSWITNDSSPIPSLAAVKAQQADLADKLQKLNDQKKDLETQRAQAIESAEKLRNRSEAATGKKSVELFTEATAQTKKAADLGADLETLSVSIAQVNEDQALAAAQQAQLEAAVGSLQKQSETVTKGWTDVQALIKSNSDFSQSLVDGTVAATPAAPAADAAPGFKSTSDSSITGLLAKLQQRADEAQQLRQAAIVHLDAAKKTLIEAAKLSDTVRVAFGKQANAPELQTLPQVEAWRSMMDIHNASDNKLIEALLWQRYARLYADWAQSAAARADSLNRLDKALTATKLTAPTSLDSKAPSADADESHKLADDAFAKIDSLLVDVQKSAEGGRASAAAPLAKNTKQVAQNVQIIALYAHGQFDAAMGDQKNAADYLGQAKSMRDTALAANIPLPVLPAELTPPPTVAVPSTNPSGKTSPGSRPAINRAGKPPAATSGPGASPAANPATPAPATPTPAAAPPAAAAPATSAPDAAPAPAAAPDSQPAPATTPQ